MEALGLGVAMGLASGLSPGPLLAAIVAASLRRGFAGGLRVAVAPLLTDVPIVATALLVAGTAPSWLLTGLAVAGGALLVALGAEALRDARRFEPVAGARAAGRGGDLARGALVNALNPAPWLFWLGVGAPVLARAWAEGPATVAAFVVPFYVLLVGAKIALAAGVAAGRHRLPLRAARGLMAAAGVGLGALGVGLLVDAVA